MGFLQPLKTQRNTKTFEKKNCLKKDVTSCALNEYIHTVRTLPSLFPEADEDEYYLDVLNCSQQP